MEENNTIFREKSVERISSPEELDSYLKVTSPSVWIVLAAIIVLLIGIICWAVVGEIETTTPSSCRIEKGELVCYVTENIAQKIDEGMAIKLPKNDTKYNIYSIEYLGQVTAADLNIAHVINAEIKDHIYELRAKCDLPDSIGMIQGKIVLETISPIKFVFN